MRKVCQMTTVHSFNDIRIFEKECKTLSREYEVTLICTNTDKKEKDSIIIDSFQSKGRLNRMIFSHFRVLKKAMKKRYDVYHFHDPELMFVGLILKAFGKKVIYDVHEDLPLQILRKSYIPIKVRKPLSRLVNFIEKNISRVFNHIVCATSTIESKFKKYNKNTTTLRNFPKLGMFERNGEVDREGVCYVGGIAEVRGFSEMLEACKLAKTPLYLAGRSNIKDFEQRVSANELFNFLGYLNKKEVNDLYNKSFAGLVVLHGIEAFKVSLPIKMFEYMSAGIPVIYSNFPLWEELIGKYNCGIAVDPNDVVAISEAITFLKENKEEAKVMGKNGQEAIKNDLNWDEEGKKLIEVYKSITG